MKLLLVLSVLGQVVDAPGLDEAERQRQAKVLLDRGLERYEAKDYERAIESFKAAYALAPAPGLFFNMAQAYRLWGKGHCADASRTYRAYLQASPGAGNREKVEGHLKALDACARDEEPAPAPAKPALEPAPVTVSGPPAQLVPEPVRERVEGAEPPIAVDPPTVMQPRRSRWPPLGSVLAGAAVLGFGAGLYGWAGQDYANLSLTCSAGDCAPSEWQGSQLKEQLGVAMLAIGAVVMVGAAIWFLVVTAGDS